MADDSVTETTTQSWFSRIGGAIAGAVFGVILFFGSFVVLWLNEGHAIKEERSLLQGSKEVVSVSASTVDPANESKLVHVTGDLSARGPVKDKKFGITEKAIKLRRDVEMYQWTENKKSETKKNLGGSEDTVTTYTYEKKWSPTVIDSSEFHKKEGHRNPEEMSVKDLTFVAEDIKAGAFALPDSLVEKIDDFKPLEVKAKNSEEIADNFSAPIKTINDGYFIGKDSDDPVVGDLRVHFQEVLAGPVSIVAKQIQSTFEPYSTKEGKIELLQLGTVSADNMFKTALENNAIVTWILRAVGWFMMFLGIVLIGNPLSVLGDLVPFIGNLLGAGISLIALVISAPLALISIALAWLAYRPLLGIPLLLVALALIVLGVRALGKKKALKAQTA
ncbi:hypothetical protein BH09VER1_BH09VER1_19060 [soil metagenome]